jgi:polysaccharide transporter, PST family
VIRSLANRAQAFFTRPITVNSLWLMADRVGRLAINFFVMVWVARHLGPEGYGHLQLGVALVALLAFSHTLGLEQIAVRAFAAQPNAQGAILGTVIGLRLGGGAIGYAALLAFLWLAEPYDAQTRLIAAILGLGLILQGADAIDWWFLSQTRSRFSVIAKLSAFSVATGWRVGAVLLEAGVVAIALATLIELVLARAFLTIVFKRFGSMGQPLRFEWARAKPLLLDAFPLLLSSIAILIYMRSDQVLLGAQLGVAAVGVDAAATRLSEVWYMIPNTVVASASPKLVKQRTSDPAVYEANLIKLFRFLLLASLALALPIALLADWIVHLLYGPAFEGAADVLRLHVFACVLVFQAVAQAQWMINEGQQRWLLARTITGAIVAVGLNLLLIPRLGLIGAPLALLGGQLAVMLFPALTPTLRPVLRLQLKALLPMRS